jgi:hypothetical protein
MNRDTRPDDLRPYEPPGAPRFAIGDRVRVRLSGECRALFRRYSHLGETYHSETPARTHFEQEDGQTGAVIERPAARKRSNQGHDVLVEFDVPLDVPGSLMVAHGYAAAELEPLEDVDADR